MIVEAEIEEKIAGLFAAALDEAGLQKPRTELSWGVADPGDVKGRGDASGVILSVAVGIRTYPEYVSPQFDLPCAAVLTVRRDVCPTGAALADYIEPVLEMLHDWQTDIDLFCDDLAGTSFRPAGFNLTGGERQQTESVWIVSFSFTLRGVV